MKLKTQFQNGSNTFLIEKRQRTFFGSLLRSWFWLAAPAEVPPDAELYDREIVRRGKIGSIALLISFIDTLIPLILSFSFPNIALRFFVIISTLLCLIAFLLNRTRRIALAGLLCVIGTEIGLFVAVLGNPVGLTFSSVQIFFLFVQSELYAATLLPAFCIFIVAAFNIVSFNVIYNVMPHTQELARLIAIEGPLQVVRASSVQLVVAIIVFLWVKSAHDALKRADRSDSVAAIERNFASKDRAEKEKMKRDIEEVVQVIAGTDQKPQSELPVDSQKPFWQIYVALNTMRKRHARDNAEVMQRNEELRQMQNALTQLSHYLEQPEQKTSWQRTGTSVDMIALQVMNRLRQTPSISSDSPPLSTPSSSPASSQRSPRRYSLE